MYERGECPMMAPGLHRHPMRAIKGLGRICHITQRVHIRKNLSVWVLTVQNRASAFLTI